jgi:hypothetical protein
MPDASPKAMAEGMELLGLLRESEGMAAFPNAGSHGVQSQDTLSYLDE